MSDLSIQVKTNPSSGSSLNQNKAGVLADNDSKIEQLVILGEELSGTGDTETARQAFQLALKLAPGNPRATFALYNLTDDCYEARNLVKMLLLRHPGNTTGKRLLEEAEKRCHELEAMIKGSAYLQFWEERERLEQERLRFSRDRRTAPISKLGKLLLEARYITEEQLDTAVNLQTMLARFEDHQPLGKILLDYNYITQSQLDEILKLQETEYLSQMY
jgi:tetratricopeptide (TPR) repeat protein